MRRHGKGTGPDRTIAQNPEAPSVTGRQGRSTNQLQYLLHCVTVPLCEHPDAEPFLEPVDAIRLKLHDYYVIIKQPMDLGTIRKRLENNYYLNAAECQQDYEIMFRNCHTYNKPQQDICATALRLEEQYSKLLANMPAVEVDDAHEGRRSGAQTTGRRGTSGTDEPEFSCARTTTYSRATDESTPRDGVQPLSKKGKEIAMLHPSSSVLQNKGVASTAPSKLSSRATSGQCSGTTLKTSSTPSDSGHPASKKGKAIQRRPSNTAHCGATSVQLSSSSSASPAADAAERNSMMLRFSREQRHHAKKCMSQEGSSNSCLTAQKVDGNSKTLMDNRSTVTTHLPPSDGEEETETFTYEDKRQMVHRMHLLPLKNLVEVLQNLQKMEPSACKKQENDDVDVDLDDLQHSTLEALNNYLMKFHTQKRVDKEIKSRAAQAQPSTSTEKQKGQHLRRNTCGAPAAPPNTDASFGDKCAAGTPMVNSRTGTRTEALSDTSESDSESCTPSTSGLSKVDIVKSTTSSTSSYGRKSTDASRPAGPKSPKSRREPSRTDTSSKMLRISLNSTASRSNRKTSESSDESDSESDSD